MHAQQTSEYLPQALYSHTVQLSNIHNLECHKSIINNSYAMISMNNSIELYHSRAHTRN